MDAPKQAQLGALTERELWAFLVQIERWKLPSAAEGLDERDGGLALRLIVKAA